MYCPNCGQENAKAQKFCRRCGANLLAVDLAREFISEAAGNSTRQVETGTILKTVTFISIFGFFFVTVGAVFMSLIQYSWDDSRNGPPMGLMLAMFGYAALVLICWRLLRLSDAPTRNEARQPVFQPGAPVSLPAYNPAAHAAPMPGETNRRLGEAPQYQSVIEPETQQFQPERRTNS